MNNSQITTVFVTAVITAAICITAFAFIRNKPEENISVKEFPRTEETTVPEETPKPQKEVRNARRTSSRSGFAAIVQQPESGQNIPPAEELRQNFLNELEKHRAKTPEERAEAEKQLVQLSDFLKMLVPAWQEMIMNGGEEELQKAREQFLREEEMFEHMSAANLESLLTPEEDKSIGAFFRDIRSLREYARQFLFGDGM